MSESDLIRYYKQNGGGRGPRLQWVEVISVEPFSVVCPDGHSTELSRRRIVRLSEGARRRKATEAYA
jgi:hypothetical protein